MCSVIQLYPTLWTVAHQGAVGVEKGIFPIQESNQCLLHCRQILNLLAGNPITNILSTTDFTHMPSVKRVKFLLVFVDTFSGWTEAFLTTNK